MNKTELVKYVADTAEVTQAVSSKAITAIIDAIRIALKKGDDVTLVGFGTFSVSERAARVGHNPRTGEKLNIPATKAVKFTAGKELKDAVKHEN